MLTNDRKKWREGIDKGSSTDIDKNAKWISNRNQHVQKPRALIFVIGEPKIENPDGHLT